MSGLQNLFGSSSAAPDNNDALKFVAPKAKDVKKAAAAAAVSSAPTPAASVAVKPTSGTVAAPNLTSKAMASATVRLYRMNPSTNAYEAIAGAAPLGCVAMGVGSMFQLLVYNSQKAPQAVIQITNTFEYTLRDQYMSCKDSQGNAWSLLFDNIDQMRVMLRAVMACVAQVCSRNSATTRDIVVGVLPGSTTASSNATINGAEVALACGMSAGVHFTAWELGEPDDTSSNVPEICYPADMLNSTSGNFPPFLKILPPQEVAKVKIGTADAPGEEPIGGLGEALSGYKKGDKLMVALAPKKVFSGSASDRMIDLRKRMEAWVVVELEIVRVKSTADKKKKDETANAAVDTGAPVPATDQGETVGRGRTESDLAIRMAKLAAKSGGGGNPMMGGMVMSGGSGGGTGGGIHGNTGHLSAQSQGNEQQRQFNDNYNQGSQSQNLGGNQNQNQYQNQNQNQQSSPNAQHNNNGQYNNQQQQYNQNQNQYQNQNQNQNLYQQNYNNQQQQQPQPSYPAPPADSNPYAVTLVPGQESRSAYMPQQHNHNQHYQQNNQNPYGEHQQSIINPHNSINSVGGYHHQQQQPASMSMSTSGPVEQSLAQLQVGMTQLHAKIDRLGSGGMGLGGLTMTHKNSGSTGLQVKASELVTVAQSLLSEYESQLEAVDKRTKELDSHASTNTSSMLELKQQYEREFKEEREKLRKERDDKDARCEKLEEKLEALQAKNEKMMADKTAMLEKQQDQFEKSADQNSRYFALQQEVEELRRTAAAATANASAQAQASAEMTSAADKQIISDLKATNAELLDKLSAAQDAAGAARHNAAESLSSVQNALTAANDKLNNQMSSYEEKLAALQNQLTEKQNELDSAYNKASEAEGKLEAAAASAAVAATSNAVPTLLSLQEMLEDSEVSAHIEELLAKEKSLSDASLQELKLELELSKKATATAEAATKTALEAAASTTGNTGNTGNGISNDKIKELVSDVYTKMVEALNHRASVMEEVTDGPARFEQKDIIKLIRSVLKQVSQDHST